ncbi:MFS transporter [Desulfovibrio sp. OttesenSCG-928-A18]|nr:MFS transporter [Desulfovibrio sp. OttesenSCG-928-A18]
MSSRLTLFLALSCGLILTNLYSTQPLLAEIAQDIGLEQAASGLIVTLAQAGYCCGVLFITPMGDMLENKRLMAVLLFGDALVLLAAGLVNGQSVFLASMFGLGLCTSVVQVLIPYGTGLAEDAVRGRTFGVLAAGAVLGIAVSRPLSSMVAGMFSWRAYFQIFAVLMAAVGLIFVRFLPAKHPSSTSAGYIGILRSMPLLLRDMPELRSRLLFMALVFFGFGMFWAAAPTFLKSELGYTQQDITLFSMASLVAPVCAIMAGRLTDRGLGFITASVAVVLSCTAFLLTPVFGFHAALFAVAMLLLDSGTHGASVVTQQTVISMRAEARSRLNALYISCMFSGGALGSAFGPWLYSSHGWTALSMTGVVVSLAAFGIHLWKNRQTTRGIL